MSEFLEGFHRVLVQEIRKTRPEYLETRFTVAEIYQNLVPYRTHRDAIGVEMNGDYEDTLLRLLAGEGDFLMIESEVARREIREELQSSNPNTGLFRDFAAADVRLTSAHESVPEQQGDGDEDEAHETADLADLLAAVDADNATDDGEADAEEADDDKADAEAEASKAEPELELVDNGDDADAGVDDNADEDDGAAGDEDGESANDAESDTADEDDTVDDDAKEHDAEVTEDSEGEADSSASEVCHWCRADLPERSVLNYCPFCGSDLRLTPCGQCGEELEPGWRFCPECGTESED